MNTPTARDAAADFVTFKDKPVRFVIINGVPWFSLEDSCDAIGRNFDLLARQVVAVLPAYAWRECTELAAEGTRDSILISPVGAWMLTELAACWRTQDFAAWACRESRNLCPNPAPFDPAMFLTLLPSGFLPPKPLKYTGRLAEWKRLKQAYPTARAVLHFAAANAVAREVAA